ncbi:hypothetical protein ACSIGC_01380 [Tenacibaculum sp. ZS6-P6]|uniref:hypothetical protein n=1 Tax=Tenacibaculum sp. ZS6-P6 TaxID=3447503 RepID=UPI003F9D4F63
MRTKSIILTLILILSSIAYNLAAQTNIKVYGKNENFKKAVGNITLFIKGKGKFHIEYEGDIEVSDDDKDIISISRDGFIEIKKTSFGKKRRLVIEAESGSLKKRYYVGWSEKNFDPEGKIWLAEILPEIVRYTGIAAKSRVERFYRRGGATAVFNEIEKLNGDYAESTYFKLLLDKGLDNSELIKLINLASTTIDSDYYLSDILQKNQNLFLQNEQSVSAYLNATKTIKSDYYKSQLIENAIDNTEITDEQLDKLLEISKNISSDYYLSEVLTKILENRDLNKSNMNKIMKLSNSISSDYYKSQILKKALKKKDLSKENYDTFIKSMGDVDSDYYASNVIKDLLKKDLNDKSLNELITLVEKNVDSDYYASDVYKKLAKRDLTEKQLIKILESLHTINSSNYLSSVLIAFAPSVKQASQRVKDAYLKRAKSIDSDLYFGRAIKAIY